MNGALNAWRDGVAEQLRQAGLNAVAAMDCAAAARWREAVAAVAVSKVACASGGFQDYLGVGKDPETGREGEVFGRRAELTLALDIFAPRDGGGDACRKAAEYALELGLFTLGSSDCHIPEKVGVCATYFPEEVHTMQEFLAAFKKGGMKPAYYTEGGYQVIDIKNSVNLRAAWI